MGVERLTNDPRGGNIDLAGATPDRLAHGLRGDTRGLVAFLARKGIRVAGIDDERAGTAVLKIGSTPQDRRRACLGLRQHPGRGRPGLQYSYHEVRPPLVADPGLTGRKPHALHGWKRRQPSWRER